MTTQQPTQVLAPISVGELIDKITILELKQERIQQPGKLANIRRELALLSALLDSLMLTDPMITTKRTELKEVNGNLWDIENYKRSAEREQRFDEGFLNAARQVYIKNDQRADIKLQINRLANSLIQEEKSY